MSQGKVHLDVQRQMGHTRLSMTNHYASLTVEHLQRSHEKFSPLKAEKKSSGEAFGEGYWHEE